MNIVILNTSDIIGGAARAAYRIHKALYSHGMNSMMMVQLKASDDQTVLGPQNKIAKVFNSIRPLMDSLPLQFYRNRKNSEWSVGWLPKKITEQIARFNPDIISLQWVNGGFLPYTILNKFKKPLVWTLHDCWAFTGGCHYPYECNRYQQTCGSCPQLGSKHEWDLSRWVWTRKFKHLDKSNLTIVSPSYWLAKLVKSSSLFSDVRIEVIPYCINLNLYKPINKEIAKDLLCLPQNKKLVLFSALNSRNKRKGFHYLKQGIKLLYDKGLKRDLQLIIVGNFQSSEIIETGFECLMTGRLSDDISLALFYSAADVFVAPSTADNMPLTVLEALACGTPTVAFDIGGMPDLIEHHKNGYLAKPFDTEDLAKGIAWIIANNDRHLALCKTARLKTEKHFSIPVIAGKYIDLFNNLKNLSQV